MPASTSRTTSTRSVDERVGEAGSGAVSSIVGVTVVLVLLLFAVQLTLNLYASSAVTAAAFDAARHVAGADGGPSSTAEAEERARSLLDRFETGGGTLEFRWDTSHDDVVVLEVIAERPSLLANVRFPFQRVDRTVTVRWEHPR
jgi:hypothetical protein